MTKVTWNTGRSVSATSPSLVPFYRQLQIGTCHLPLQGFNQVLLWLLTFSTPWREFRSESRNEALCALEKLAEQTSRERDIFRSWFYEPNSCIPSYLEKHLIPLWWHLLLRTSRKPSTKKKKKAWLHVLPFYQNHIYTEPPHYLFGAVSQELPRMPSPKI